MPYFFICCFPCTYHYFVPQVSDRSINLFSLHHPWGNLSSSFFTCRHLSSLPYIRSESDHLLFKVVWSLKSWGFPLPYSYDLLLPHFYILYRMSANFLALLEHIIPQLLRKFMETGQSLHYAPHVNDRHAFWCWSSVLIDFKCFEFHVSTGGKYFENLHVWK